MMAIEKDTFGERLRKLREMRGLSRKKLAELAGLSDLTTQKHASLS